MRPASTSAASAAEPSSTGTPAAVAIRAASTLLAIPPLPRPAAPVPPPRPRRGRLAPHVGEQPGPGLPGVAVVQAVDVGQEHERVGADQVGDQRGQPVVVAEPDLLGGDGVVLVDHRQHAQGQQALQGGLGVAVVGPPHDVVGGEQHLARPCARAGRTRWRTAAPAGTARRRRRPAASPGRAAAGPGPAAPGRRRSRPRRRGRPGRRGAASASTRASSRSAVETAGGGRQRGRPDLDDDAARVADRRAAHCRRRAGPAAGRPGPGRGRAARRGAGSWRTAARRRAAGCPARAGRRCRAEVETKSSSCAGCQSKPTVADADLGARLGTGVGERLLDAEPGQPVGEVADGLVVVEVGLLHPALGLVAARRRSPSSSRPTVKPTSSTAVGRSTIRVASSTGRAARSAATSRGQRERSARAAPRGSRRRSRSTCSPRASSSGADHARRARGRRGRRPCSARRGAAGPTARSLYCSSSASMTSRSVSGSRPGSKVAQSRTCTSTAQRSTWRRNSRPSPLPCAAPGIRPGHVGDGEDACRRPRPPRGWAPAS